MNNDKSHVTKARNAPSAFFGIQMSRSSRVATIERTTTLKPPTVRFNVDVVFDPMRL
jgi:hypothetical protein